MQVPKRQVPNTHRSMCVAVEVIFLDSLVYVVFKKWVSDLTVQT